MDTVNTIPGTVDATRIFGDNAAAYDRAREKLLYPKELVAQVCEEMKLPRGAVVLDIGAGSGALGSVFERLGHEVRFVEPNDTFLGILERHHPGKAFKGTGEDIPTPDHRADLIVMGDSAHWIDPEKGLKEFKRVLKPGGRVAAFRRQLAKEHPVTIKLHELLLANSPSYADSGSQLLREDKRLRLRFGQHLVSEEQNCNYALTSPVSFAENELLAYLETIASTHDWIKKDLQDFRHKIVTPLLEFARHNGYADDSGNIKLAFETGVLYGARRETVIEKATQAHNGTSPGDITVRRI